jgi:hypothetical protein
VSAPARGNILAIVDIGRRSALSVELVTEDGRSDVRLQYNRRRSDNGLTSTPMRVTFGAQDAHAVIAGIVKALSMIAATQTETANPGEEA